MDSTIEANPNRQRFPRIVGIFVLFVWAHGLLALWPTPASADSLADPLWQLWITTLVFTVAGIATGIMAYRGVRLWWAPVLLLSGLMVLINVVPTITQIMDSPSLGHWIDTWMRVFGRLIDKGGMSEAFRSAYWPFVYPAYHLLLVIVIVSYLVAGVLRRQRVV